MPNKNINIDELVEMIKELNLEPDYQVELIQRLEHEGLTDELKQILLDEVALAETNIAQEQEILALAEEVSSHPEKVPQMLEDAYQEMDQGLSSLEAGAGQPPVR